MKKVKIVSLILLMAMAWTLVFNVVGNNCIYAAISGSVSYLLDNPEQPYYCVEEGKHFTGTQEFEATYTESLSETAAYVIGKYGKQTDINVVNSHKSDPGQQAIWGHPSASDSAEAAVVKNLESGKTIKITMPSGYDENSNTCLTSNAEGKYGPFIIEYPTLKNGDFVGKSLSIKINDKELTEIPASGKEFYLDADKLNFGQKNTITVKYEACKYSGTIQIYTAKLNTFITCDTHGVQNISTVYRGINSDVLKTSANGGSVYTLGKKKCPECDRLFKDAESNYYTAKNNKESASDSVDHWKELLDNTNPGTALYQIRYENWKNAQNDYNEACRKYNNAKTRWDMWKERADIKYDEDVVPVQTIGKASIDKYDEIKDEVSKSFDIGKRLVIDINKLDNGIPANKLANVKFNVKLVDASPEKTFIWNAETKKAGLEGVLTTDEEGKATQTIVTFEDEVVVTLEEQKDNFHVDPGLITVKFKYNKEKEMWETELVTPTEPNNKLVTYKTEYPDDDKVNNCKITLNIVNKLRVSGFKLIKINSSVEGEKIKGVEFEITLTNARDKDGNIKIVKATDANGEISIGELEVINPSEKVLIAIREVNVPNKNLNYEGLYSKNGELTIIIDPKTRNVSATKTGDIDNSYFNISYDNAANIITTEIKNKVTVSLEGQVWLDGQTGLKPVKEPNSIKDNNEKGLAKVKVNAVRVSDNKVIATTVTDANGNYAFKELPESVLGNISYYIEYVYDGINYKAVEANVGGNEATDSDGTEIGRTEFNNKFKTITKGKATGTATTALSYKYDEKTGTSTLVTENKEGTVKDEFAIKATTLATTYNENTKNIDLGLVKKGVDLATVVDLNTAEVTINGETKQYTYNQLKTLGKEDNIFAYNITIDKNEKKYSLYLYNSDYNYRIINYSELPVLTNTTKPELQEGDKAGLLTKKKADGELDVELTYDVWLYNQGATDATINEIAIYYDKAFVLEGDTPVTAKIEGAGEYNKVTRKVNLDLTNGENQQLYNITFKLGKDQNGNLNLGENKKVWVEITSYSTNSGCVDIDSAPDNIEEHKKEDDTDDSNGLNIKVNNFERTISGYVFEDNRPTAKNEYNVGNGLFDNNENKVNDVIVQLIELKTVNILNKDVQLEYIWQETVTGTNTVKYITTDGRNIATYNVTNNAGEYKFEGIIPGDYIVRFIYGDGTYFDKAIDGNNTGEAAKARILKYNGQDYKSTIDPYYNEKVMSTKYKVNGSMARDNEARRIEEMGYAMSDEIKAATDLIIDSKEKLAKTWMCAETSTIEIRVSEAEDKKVEKNANLGLTLRPQPELTLEKHITALSIDGVTNATANDLENYNTKYEGQTIKNSGEGVLVETTNKATGQRGKWTVQTETSLISGKRMEITYGYIVKNLGDKDYVGTQLKAEVANNRKYEDIAANVKNSIKTLSYTPGVYLGTAYYMGQVGQNGISESEVGINVKIEDYIKKDNVLELAEEKDFGVIDNNRTAKIFDISGNESTESVIVLQTKTPINLKSTETSPITMKVTCPAINTTSGNNKFTYPSYAAQLVGDSKFTNEVGTLLKGASFGNLEHVQSYAPLTDGAGHDIVPLSLIVPEIDEYIAETVEVTLDTGADRKSPTMLIISIAGGLTVLAVGIVLIKKFTLK